MQDISIQTSLICTIQANICYLAICMQLTKSSGSKHPAYTYIYIYSVVHLIQIHLGQIFAYFKHLTAVS